MGLFKKLVKSARVVVPALFTVVGILGVNIPFDESTLVQIVDKIDVAIGVLGSLIVGFQSMKVKSEDETEAKEIK